MKKLIAGLSASTLVLGLAACIAGDSGGSEANYVRVLGTEPQQGLIPGMTNENGGGRVVDMLFSGLVYYDADGKVHNEMAESIDLEGDRTYRVHLKPDLAFSDGSPVNAESFVDTWNFAVANEQLNESFFSSILGYEPGVDKLEGLKVIDDRTFSIELTQPESDFPTRLGYNAYFPLPPAALEDMDGFGETPVSNGPYKIVSWDHNRSLKIEPNPEYGGERVAQNEGLEYVFYSDTDAAYMDLLANNLDVLEAIPSASFGSYQQDLGTRSETKPAATYLEMSIHEETPHFSGEEGKIRRKAVSMAIDRPAIAETIFNGTRTPAREFTSPVLEGYDPNLPGSENLDFNPSEAQRLWQEADETYGAFAGEFPINYNVDGDNKDWADAVANNISNTLGIQAIGNPFPDFKSFRDAYRTERMDGAYRTAWLADYPSMGNFLGPNFTTGVASNDSKYANPEFDRLIVEANGAQDAAQAARLYNQAQELLLRDLPAIPLFYPNVVGGWSENVDNVEFSWKSLPVYYNITKQ
ncbi:peptide ABC transporter substrate-binding protein [Corynebacterium flavescens]|uniref:ABC transporter substrate-binding protein n=1 Tax=Corynebacterium flavescens TaxID=28028 RepID=A0A1L7CL99_CORFL|nr:ABC transporter substrate-binding protein [Corynebacterium flavescens]APT86636.1 ABC transporter substrate-binding protein [Corynebacterium flavescens]KAA8722802.1 ABC transporter substrate-binding protein [Corynebacterium flavescens]GEB96601.1 ABC transporter substrate-binding protein [Corynebacterium flavescens]